MAGYKRPAKTYLLQFDDEEYQGLEVEMTGASLGVILDLQRLSERLDATGGAANSAVIQEMIEVFSTKVIRWNLLDENDQVVPHTPEGLATQDLPFIMTLIAAWTKAVAGVSAPLDGASSSGETSLEGSLPMDTL